MALFSDELRSARIFACDVPHERLGANHCTAFLIEKIVRF